MSDVVRIGMLPILKQAEAANRGRNKKNAFMNKRDRFIAELKEEAKAAGLSFRVEAGRGKGGHAMVYVGDKLTTSPSREIDPKTARKIRKQLGLG
jgi:hypothetical protein